MTEDAVQSILEAGRALGGINTADGHGQFVVIPENYQVKMLEELLAAHLPNPRRIKGTINADTCESFIQYVREYQTRATKVFATVSSGAAPKFTAVLDYHEGPSSPVIPFDAQTAAEVSATEISASSQCGQARWGQHRAIYACSFSVEWARWMDANKKRMSQSEFAQFLEDNQLLIVNPPGAELLELTQTLFAKQDITCNQLVRLQNGRVRLNYDESIELKGTVSSQPGDIEFPAEVEVGIAPFDGGPAYRVRNRLRYRIESRRLVFWFEAVDVHRVIKDAVQGIVDRIQEKLNINPIYGSIGS